MPARSSATAGPTRSFRLFEAVGWDEALTEQIRELDIPEDATGLGEATARRVSVQIPDLERRAGNPLRDINLGRRLPLGADRAAGRAGPHFRRDRPAAPRAGRIPGGDACG